MAFHPFHMKRRYDNRDYSDDEPDEDYRVMLLAEAGRIPGMDIHPHGFHPHGFHPHGFHPHGFHPRGFHPHGFHPHDFQQFRKNKKKKKNKFRKQFDTGPKRPKLEETKEDVFVFERIIANLNKPSNTKAFQNCLMISNWFKEVPDDFEKDWIMVPCPRGKRMMVVAASEYTRCYAKSGELLFYFISSLPGGHVVKRDEPSKRITILDCIWHHKNQTYYVLDGLMWNSTHLLDCEAQFRFFWLEQKLLEIPSLSEQIEENDYPFVFLPRFQCQKDDIASRMSNLSFPKSFLESVDGFLFYDKNAPYSPGSSTDVGWLKPFMIPDVLKMPIGPELLVDCPNDCVDMEKYITEFEKNKKSILKKERKQRRVRYLEELKLIKKETTNDDVTVTVEGEGGLSGENSKEDLKEQGTDEEVKVDVAT